MDCVPLLAFYGHKYVLVMVCMFSHCTEGFNFRQATACFIDIVLLENIIPPWGTPLKSINEPALLDRCFDKTVLLGTFCNTFTCLPPSIFWFSQAHKQHYSQWQTL